MNVQRQLIANQLHSGAGAIPCRNFNAIRATQIRNWIICSTGMRRGRQLSPCSSFRLSLRHNETDDVGRGVLTWSVARPKRRGTNLNPIKPLRREARCSQLAAPGTLALLQATEIPECDRHASFHTCARLHSPPPLEQRWLVETALKTDPSLSLPARRHSESPQPIPGLLSGVRQT
jgi:hypothetical protein